MLSSDSEFRTDWFTAVIRGIIAPAPLFAWAVYNVATGSATWGRASSQVHVVHDFYRVGGIAIIKFSLAAAIFTWFFLANFPRFDRCITGLLLSQVAAAVVGIVFIFIGALA